MAWWNKNKKVEEDVPHQQQGLLSSLDKTRRQEQSEADARERRREQERCEKVEQERQKALSLLKSQLFYCFGVNVSPQENPTHVEGMWFGVGRYIVDADGSIDDRFWYISLLVPCNCCQTLRPGFVSVITDWDDRKAGAQKRIKDQKHNPYGSSPKSWEDVVAMSQNGEMGSSRRDDMNTAGKTEKQLWIETLADYQTRKKRGLARYLEESENVHNRFFGNCPACGDHSWLKKSWHNFARMLLLKLVLASLITARESFSSYGSTLIISDALPTLSSPSPSGNDTHRPREVENGSTLIMAGGPFAGRKGTRLGETEPGGTGRPLS